MLPVFFASTGLFVFVLWCLLQRKKDLPLPPGPPPLPIIGNWHQTPSINACRMYQKWHKTYGPIVALRYGRKDVISIGSHQVARDLLEKKSSIYSSRPQFVIASQCIAKNLHTALLPYGPKWRNHHRIQASFLKLELSTNYRDVQDMESKQLVHDLLTDGNFCSHFRRFTSSVMSTMAYGQRIESPNAKVINELADLTESWLGSINSSQSVMVELFPVLNYLPRIFAPWKRKGDIAHELTIALYKKNLFDGRSSPSWNWVQASLNMKESKGLSDNEMSYIIGVLWEAGTDTTAGILKVFVLACLTFPETMRKAHTELNKVVGLDRLPSFEDMKNLPYVNALVTECLRWRPLTPLGFARVVSEDDEYMGYRIPKGAMIMPNHWTLDLDESIFKDATEFRPERWLEDPNLPLAAFGFGRRGCIGRHVARNSLTVSISRLLWAYEITHQYKDGKKQEVNPWNMEQNMTSPPADFEALFRVRSQDHEKIIMREWNAAEKNSEALMSYIHSLAL
jgi:cytochrome P450